MQQAGAGPRPNVRRADVSKKDKRQHRSVEGCRGRSEGSQMLLSLPQAADALSNGRRLDALLSTQHSARGPPRRIMHTGSTRGSTASCGLSRGNEAVDAGKSNEDRWK